MSQELRHIAEQDSVIVVEPAAYDTQFMQSNEINSYQKTTLTFVNKIISHAAFFRCRGKESCVRCGDECCCCYLRISTNHNLAKFVNTCCIGFIQSVIRTCRQTRLVACECTPFYNNECIMDIQNTDGLTLQKLLSRFAKLRKDFNIEHMPYNEMGLMMSFTINFVGNSTAILDLKNEDFTIEIKFKTPIILCAGIRQIKYLHVETESRDYCNIPKKTGGIRLTLNSDLIEWYNGDGFSSTIIPSSKMHSEEAFDAALSSQSYAIPQSTYSKYDNNTSYSGPYINYAFQHNESAYDLETGAFKPFTPRHH